MADLLVKNDTGRKLEVTLQDNGTAVDLTGATLKLHFQIGGGAVKNVAMGIVDAVNGKAEYQFLANDLQDTGRFEFDVEVTDSGGKITTFKGTITEPDDEILVENELA